MVGQLHLIERFAFLPRYAFVPVLAGSLSAILCDSGASQPFFSAREKDKSIKSGEKLPNTGSLNDLHPTFQDGKLYWPLVTVLHV